MQRGGSQQQRQQRPLVDLTPSFKEAPQWDKSRKGHGVKGIPGVPLVELATGPYGQNSTGLQRSLFRRE